MFNQILLWSDWYSAKKLTANIFALSNIHPSQITVTGVDESDNKKDLEILLWGAPGVGGKNEI